MKTLICAVLLLAAVANAYDDNDNWPLYMKKCRKNAANLEKCLLRNANHAMDSVLQGDPTIGIPVYNEYFLGNILFGQNETYKLYMENSKIYGLKHLHVTGFKWNFDLKTVDIGFLYNSAIIISGDYRESGTFKGHELLGAGNKDMIFVGGSNGANLTYNMNYELLKVLGRDYVQIKDRTCTRSEGFRINYTNKLKTKQQVAAEIAYYNQNSVEVNKSLSPELAELFCSLVSQALNAVFYNFPLDIMFDENKSRIY